MTGWGYVSLFVLVLVALLGSMAQMKNALEEANFEHFFVWTCIASVIAGLPSLW